MGTSPVFQSVCNKDHSGRELEPISHMVFTRVQIHLKNLVFPEEIELE